MGLLVTKSIQGKIIGLTNHKKELLDKEYNEFNKLSQYLSECEKYGMYEFQEYKHLKDKFKLYSLTITQAIRNCIKSKKEQPLIIHNQSIRIKITENKLTPLWIRIAVQGVRGGIWLPIKTGKKALELIQTTKTRGIKIIRKKNDYYIYITVQKEVESIQSYSNILSIDLGEKIIATVACGNKRRISKPLFLGKNVRGIRRHYAWLRKRLGEKKLLKIIKRLGQRETNKIKNILHHISTTIINTAKETNSIIVLGDLKGIRKQSNKGKTFNRIISNMPFHELTRMIKYKARWQGLTVIKINEAYTSRTCNKCGHIDKANRKNQGLFKCINCNYQVNADYNGAINILKRGLDYMSKLGVITDAQKSDQIIQVT